MENTLYAIPWFLPPSLCERRFFYLLGKREHYCNIHGTSVRELLILLSSILLQGELMKEHEKINYVEFPAKSLEASKTFFFEVFGWSFVDYGSDYVAFSGAGLDGGFYASNQVSTTKTGSALIVFYSNDLVRTQKKIENAGGSIVRDIFSFPGGKRFHFLDPNGNEYAVWSEGK